MLKKTVFFLCSLVTMGLLYLPSGAYAAGGKVDQVVIVADPRKVQGVLAWWANLYNESHAYFTLVTVLIIPIIGLIFGLLADVVMSAIGIDLKSRELSEH